MSETATETSVLENVLPQLEAEGYEVYARPAPSVLPSFLRQFQPDAVALRTDKNLLIEVLREGPSSKGKLASIRALLSDHKDWELRVYWISPSSNFRFIGAASPGSIEQSIQSVEELTARGDLSPGLLLSWATFEALGRALLPNEFARPQTPGRLIEILASRGLITPSEADGLRRLADMRNRLSHGDIEVKVSQSDVERLLSILKMLARLLLADRAS